MSLTLASRKSSFKLLLIMFKTCPRAFLRKHPLWEPSPRFLFGFGKKKETTESKSPQTSSGKGGELGAEEISDKNIHELNKEQKALNDLPIKVTPPDQERRLHWISKRAIIFYVPRRRSGYAPDYEPEYSWKAVKMGWNFLVKETIKWIKERSNLDIITELPLEHGNLDKVFQFRGPDSIAGWVTTCDSDHNEGYSTVDFSCNKDARAVFSGVLSTRLPQDGRISFAGYCNVRCPTKYGVYKQVEPYNWIIYNSIELRVRGDGRTYMINLHTPGPFDTLQDDMFSYPLYTRGGPYWQVVRIPFSKFVFGNKGRIQDVQYTLPADYIVQISITIADNTDGPFNLEIDYIGAIWDVAQEHEESRYEQYRVRDLMVQN